MSAKEEQLGALLLGAVLDAEGPVLKTTAGALVDASGVKPMDHPDNRVRQAWIIADRLAQRRRPVDAQTVFATGRTTGAFKDSDLAWLQGLQVSNALDSARFTVVADQLRKRSRGISLKAKLQEEIKQLDSGADVMEVAGRVEGAAREIAIDETADGSGADDVMEIDAEWDARERGDPNGKPLLVSTGLRALDEATGGFPPNLVIFAGLPSVGKSALLASCLIGQLRQGIVPGLFGLEDGTIWLAERLIAKELGIPLRDVGHRKRDGEAWGERYPTVMQEAANLLRPMVTYRQDTITRDALCRKGTHWVQNRKVGCLWIDHGGEVDHGRDFEDHRLNVGETFRRVRNLGIRNQVPVVALMHTTRMSDRGEGEEAPPRVSEIAESAYIERRARQIYGLWERRDIPDQLRVTILKNTKGERMRTYGIKRVRTAALIDGNDFEELSIQHERREEAKKRRLEKTKSKIEEKEAKEKMEAEAKARKQPQRTLGLEVVSGD